jgi:hypothetical protein
VVPSEFENLRRWSGVFEVGLSKSNLVHQIKGLATASQSFFGTVLVILTLVHQF